VDRLLDQREVAQILKISVRTLERHRVDGTGPRFFLVGRQVRYREADLEAWISRSVQSSTSDPLLVRLSNQTDAARHREAA
jgi:predicted DNA-binding transcriptional regulator AlpA